MLLEEVQTRHSRAPIYEAQNHQHRAGLLAVRGDSATGIFAAGLKNVNGSGHPQSWLTLRVKEVPISEPHKRLLLIARNNKCKCV